MENSTDRYRRSFLLSSAMPAMAFLASCSIDIQWTTKEEQEELIKLYEAMQSGTTLWDPAAPLKAISDAIAHCENSLLFNHITLLGKTEVSLEKKKALQTILSAALDFIKKAADATNLLEVVALDIVSNEQVVKMGVSTSDLKRELKRLSVSLGDDTKPTAFAYFDRAGVLAPRLELSIGLLRSLTESHKDAIDVVHELRKFRAEIIALPEKNGLKVVTNAMSYAERQMDTLLGVLGVDTANIEYMAALLFVVGHESAHAVLDRYSPQSADRAWLEVRSDLVGLIAAELVTGQKQAQMAANEQLFRRGKFGTTDIREALLISSQSGYKAFLTVYQNSPFSEGDDVHLPIADRTMLLEPAYKKLFNRSLTSTAKVENLS